jgi:hypothetical protein
LYQTLQQPINSPISRFRPAKNKINEETMIFGFNVDNLVSMLDSSRMANKTKKDSTNELPMFDIQEAINLVVTIHEKALETAALPDVAKGCGYANPTSTPFYRRLAAARLFKLLNSPKAELTKIASDYLKPEMEGAKQAALTHAIMGIKVYADIVNQYVGKRLNTELIANKLERDETLSITKACAKVCASAFAISLKFAGFISADGTVTVPSGANSPAETPLPDDPPVKHPANYNERGIQFANISLPDDPPVKHPAKGGNGDELENDEESQIQTLYLDNKRKRKITMKAPFTVTKEELERIRAWLGFQLIVEEAKTPPTANE